MYKYDASRTERREGNKGNGRLLSTGIYIHSTFVDSCARRESIPLFLPGVVYIRKSKFAYYNHRYNFYRLTINEH